VVSTEGTDGRSGPSKAKETKKTGSSKASLSRPQDLPESRLAKRPGLVRNCRNQQLTPDHSLIGQPVGTAGIARPAVLLQQPSQINSTDCRDPAAHPCALCPCQHGKALGQTRNHLPGTNREA
jgi:hypothetical protein